MKRIRCKLGLLAWTITPISGQNAHRYFSINTWGRGEGDGGVVWWVKGCVSHVT